MKHQQERGFTLVELLVAVGIIGVLASVSVVSVNSVRVKGRDAKRVQEAKQIQNALETFYASNNSYPLGRANAAEIADLGVPSTPIAAGDELVMCSIDSTADATVAADAYGGLGFRQDTTAAAANAAGCVGAPMMQKVPRDPVSSANYKYQATDCAQAGGASVSPCAGYTVKVTFEGRTGDFAAGERTFTQIGVQ